MSALVIYNTKWDRGTSLRLYFQYETGSSEITAVAPVDFATWQAQAAVEVVESGTQVEDASPVAFSTSSDNISLEADGTVVVTFPWSAGLDALFTNEDPVFLKYDVILQDTDGYRLKLAAGKITLEDSVTVWQTP